MGENVGQEENIKVCVRFRPVNSRELRIGVSDSQSSANSRAAARAAAATAAAAAAGVEDDGAGLVPWSWERNTVHALFPITRGERSRQRAAERYGETVAGPGTGHLEPSEFLFDRVFGPDETTEDLYDEIMQDLVQSAMEGKHCSAFAFGQTSTGKTYTMQGTSEYPGVIPRAVHDVFGYVNRASDREFLLRVSYLEVYNESINDLFEPLSTNLKVFEDPRRGPQVQGLEEKIVVTPEQVFALISAGEAQRHIGSTDYNKQSSRSHTIFRLVIESRQKRKAGEQDDEEEEEEDDAQPAGGLRAKAQGTGGAKAAGPKRARSRPARVAMLNLVDLAGSESASAVQSRERRQEGSHINKSLLTLTHIIYKLSELALKKDGSSAAATSHIPYRDSKLTRILQKSLQGNSRISIVCTATPWVGATEETLNTLRFATRAKKVRRAVHVNEVLDERALLLKYKQEIAVLRRKLAEAERKSKVVAVEAAPAPPSSPADSRLRAQIDEAIRNLNRVILNSTLQAEPATTDIKGAAARRGSLGSDSSLLPSPPSTPPRQKAGSMDASTPFFRKLLSMDHDLDRFDHKLGARLERSRSYSAVVPAPSELAAGRGSPAPMSRTRSMDLSPVAAGAGVGLAQVTAPATASATTAPAGGVRTSITSELRSIRAQLATLLSHEGPPPQVMDGPGQAAGPIEGLAQGSTMSSDAMAAYVRVLEQRVEQLEHQVAKYDLEQSVSRADRSFLENLLSEKDKTIREWSDVIEEIELKQQELEDENERLRERLRLYEAGGDGPAAHP